MKAIQIKGEIKIVGNIPKTFNNILNYDKSSVEKIYDDGWRDVIIPDHDITKQYLGSIYYDEILNVFSYKILDKNINQIKEEIINDSITQRSIIIQREIEKKIISESQLITNEEQLLEIKALFPFWENNLSIIVNNKYQYIIGDEIHLYKAVQSHISQSGWEPNKTPSLFTRVGFKDEILDWKQPTGAQDSYKAGDKVKYKNKTWISIVNNNVWKPSIYGWEEIK